MNKKHILVAAYSLDYGGIEVSLINLLKNLDYDKYGVSLVLERKEGIFLSDLPKNINVIEYRVSDNKNVFVRKFINLFKKVNWFFRYHNSFSCSISYATYSKPCSFLARASSKNSILFVHSNYYNVYNRDEKLTRSFFDGIKIHSFRSLVFVSIESRNDLCSLYDIGKKSYVINNLVDYDKIIKLSKEKIDIKASRKVFLFVGRLEEASKKVSRILNVSKLCKENSVDCQFWIIGDGPDKGMYLDYVLKHNLDNVIFFGAKKNPYPYIKKADYLILTSLYEGFPVVYNEAIALNKFILTTVDVSDDYITIPERFGIVVDSNISSIYEKVLFLVNHDIKPKEQVDFVKLNEERIKKIEALMECK